MELKFDSTKVDTVGTKTYPTPGVYDLTISGIVEQTPESGSPYVEIGLFNDAFQYSERFYTSPAALEYTTEKLQKIALAAGVPKDKIEAIKSIVQLDKLIAGKEVEYKISGKEVETEKGRFINCCTGFGSFVAPKGSKSLKFINNARGQKGDIKYLPDSQPKSTEQKSIF